MELNCWSYKQYHKKCTVEVLLYRPYKMLVCHDKLCSIVLLVTSVKHNYTVTLPESWGTCKRQIYKGLIMGQVSKTCIHNFPQCKMRVSLSRPSSFLIGDSKEMTTGARRAFGQK